MQRALEHLRGILPDEVRRLRLRGFLNTNQLLHATTLEIDRETVARKTGISEPRLLEFANQCALLEVSGLDGYLPVLRRLGITGQKALKRREAGELHRELVEALGYGAAPALSQVEYWISQVRSIDMIEDPSEESLPAQLESPSLLHPAETRRVGPEQP